MNFKAIIASALIATASISGVAQAAPTKCALRTTDDLHEFTCDHSIRINANGHKVNDIAFFDGAKRYDYSVIFWTDRAGNPDYAEVFVDGKRIAMNAYAAKNGSWCIDNNATQLCIF